MATAVLTLRLSPPGDWVDVGGLCRLMVGRRATNDALCLKLDEARLRVWCVDKNGVNRWSLKMFTISMVMFTVVKQATNSTVGGFPICLRGKPSTSGRLCNLH